MKSSSAHSDKSKTNYLEHTRCHVGFVVVVVVTVVNIVVDVVLVIDVVVVVVFRFNASNVLIQLTKKLTCLYKHSTRFFLCKVTPDHINS